MNSVQTLLNKGLSLLILIVVLLTTLPCKALESKTINLGFPENFPPFFFVNDDGSHGGISYDIVMQLLNSLGYEVTTIQYDNMQSLLVDMEMGSLDIAVHLTATKSRSEIAFFTKTPHIYETQNFIVRADAPIQYSGQLLQIASKRIGAINGWTHGEDFDNAKFLNKVFVNDSVQQMKGLMSGRYDVAVNNPLFFFDIAEHMQIAKAFKVLQPEIANLPVNIAISKKTTEAQQLVKTLDKAVQQFIETDSYQMLLLQYGFLSQDEASN
ncbi:substrate-binding periplasmic protein [Pseudoalteromonas pernae]|uniref:substrate-binding periplasmic protein n=1 Tax=Pseudoalteromonas pernae TaxID=3118054 RepID=UPI00324289BA